MKSQSEGLIIIRVIDNGHGISKKDQRHIFEPYYKLRMSRGSNKPNNVGLGVGLSISKRICQQLGGDVKIKHSKLEQGSTFEFSIECQREAYIEESDNLSLSFNSQASQAFLARREKLKVKVGKTFQEDDSSFTMHERSVSLNKK